MNRYKLLVVDDEDTLCEALRFNLEIEGYDVDVAHSAEEALKLNLENYSLILLDVMMGEISGFRMAQMMRANPKTADVPIIFLTAKDNDDDMIAGLKLGGDDYITKPYSIRNVLARIETVLRRAKTRTTNHEILRFQGIAIDINSKRLEIDGNEIKIPKKELEILQLFISNRNRVFSREEILNTVWRNEAVVVDRTVDVHITRLRKRLGEYGHHIITRSGYGYGFSE
ncbi:MAG: response regulator transcription factor [Duncaniella sp.]|nr:response regulator transcription factor [Duncaniella sp.]MDE6188285.1 response regulator transcription factor [Duncaniella sp.]